MLVPWMSSTGSPSPSTVYLSSALLALNVRSWSTFQSRPR